MSIAARLARLEQLLPSPDRPSALALNLPDGAPDLMLIGGQWRPCRDVAAVLRMQPPVKVYKSVDPREI